MFESIRLWSNNRFVFVCVNVCLLYIYICLFLKVTFFLLSNWQTAIKMYKLVGEERFLLWAVCSIQLQVLPSSIFNPKLSFAVSIKRFYLNSLSIWKGINMNRTWNFMIWWIDKKIKYISNVMITASTSVVSWYLYS